MRRFSRPEKPPLRLQTTTLWEYPSQHYAPPGGASRDETQGDPRYVGATPSWVVWNVLQRYTQPTELIVDPFCGSGTTLDVARDTGRRARGFDLSPPRADVETGDARALPLEGASADLVFMDPPYGDHIHYSDDPKCIGKLSAYEPARDQRTWAPYFGSPAPADAVSSIMIPPRSLCPPGPESIGKRPGALM